ncbi:glycine-rich domain-containing protein [Rugamonas sp. CCM 8940]|uniref:glycine-rich domain-containing protein n=1 Tax=Rugamonas sp. CCM 8940 TaxID=2765359 RepID=UPI0018F5FACD|nr:glycine-rich domain-containing protein-like [Rugamonas sp. CCM 8940]MBJ7311814.1 glycine-rich domain-containing protein-like [Rugamonas sp. CCM 8940]
MISNDSFKVIAALDLEPIKVKLMHAESGEGWSLDQVNAVEFEYRRFLYLMKTYPQEQTAPLFDVDIFWHYHILDTMKYAADCQAVFGYFLHHFPYLGLRGEDDEAAHHRVGERMRELYEATFGDSYLRPAAQAYSGVPAQQASAYSGVPAVAYSGVPQQQAMGTAYSGVPAVAYSGVPAQQAKGTAYSGVPNVVYSGVPAQKMAYSGVPTQNMSAYSGVPQQQAAAYSGVPSASTTENLYSTRPRLSA